MSATSPTVGAASPVAAAPVTVPYQGGLLPIEKLREGGRWTAPYNEQLLRFMLLTEMLGSTTLCMADIRVCLAKYIKSMRSQDREALCVHLPNIEKLGNDQDKFACTIKYLATLGDLQHGEDSEKFEKYLVDASRAARLRLAEDPNWFCGSKGWFLWMAYGLAKKPIFVGKGENREFSHCKFLFWFGELEVALWVAEVARIRICMTKEQAEESPFFTAERKRELAENWIKVFGLFWNKHHDEKVCQCELEDKQLVYSPDFKGYKPDTFYGKEHKAQVSMFEKELGSIVGFRLDTLYHAALPLQKHQPSGFVADHYRARWHSQELIDMRTGLVHLSNDLARSVLEQIQIDNPKYIHVNWKGIKPVSSNTSSGVNKVAHGGDSRPRPVPKKVNKDQKDKKAAAATAPAASTAADADVDAAAVDAAALTPAPDSTVKKDAPTAHVSKTGKIAILKTNLPKGLRFGTKTRAAERKAYEKAKKPAPE